MIQHWPLLFHGVNIHRVWVSFSGNMLYVPFLNLKNKKKNHWGALCYIETILIQHGWAALSELGREGALLWPSELSHGPLSSPSTWSPRNIGITFTSWNLWRKRWPLCKPGVLRPGCVPVSPKHLKQGLHCCRRWRERGTSRGQLNLFWVWGPGEAEVCPSVRNVGGWVGLLEMVGTCPALWRELYYHTDVPGPSLTTQITPNQSFWDFYITKPICQVSCWEGEIWLWPN